MVSPFKARCDPLVMVACSAIAGLDLLTLDDQNRAAAVRHVRARYAVIGHIKPYPRLSE
jgi:hypothetical protein